MTEKFEIQLGGKTGRAVVSATQGGHTATLYWFPDQRILRAPGQTEVVGQLQQHHEFGRTRDDALSALREWALGKFSSVGDYCESLD